MAKDKTLYTCSACGGSTPRWLGRCPQCGEWNTLVESTQAAPAAGKNRYSAMAALAPSSAVAVLGEIEAAEVARTPTGQEELDRVLGGGIVAGADGRRRSPPLQRDLQRRG